MQASFLRLFASFSIRNYRLYFFGQGISMCGTWMQTIGLTWLIFELTHSGTQVGLIQAAQFAPILLFGVWGGVIADRFNKRRVLFITQTIFAVVALLLGLIVVYHVDVLWPVYVLAFCLGLITVVDTPTRQTFVVEMVGKDRLRNAVTLNSTMVNVARVIGPSIAGVIIAIAGVGPLFLINAVSYVTIIWALALMNKDELHPTPRAPRRSGQIREGIAYAWHVPSIRSILIMMVIIGTFAYEFPVSLPLFSTYTLHGNAGTYSSLMAAMGLGAVIGGLYSAGKGVVRFSQLILAALLFGVSILFLSQLSSYAAILLTMVVVGGLSVLFVSMSNTTLQLTTEPEMRGRVFSLWSIGFQGTTPIGGPIIGFISDNTDPRIGLIVGGLSAVIAAGVGSLIMKSSLTKKPQVKLGNP